MHFFQLDQSLLALLKCFSLFSSEVRLVAVRSNLAELEGTAAVEDNSPAAGEADSIQAAGSVAIVPGSDRTLGVVAAIDLGWDRKSVAAALEAVAATVDPGSDRMAAVLSQSAVAAVEDRCFHSIFCTRSSNRGTAAAGKGNPPYLRRVTQYIRN